MGGGRPLAIPWREDAATLFQAYRRANLPDIKPRLHALWLLRFGYRLEETAKIIGIHYLTLQQWVAWYRQGGLATVGAHPKGGKGRTSWLSRQQQEQLRQQVAQGRFLTAQEAVGWVAQTFGVQYTQGSMYSLLARLNSGKKVPRPLAEKASLEGQEQWKRGA
jgi:transposase